MRILLLQSQYILSLLLFIVNNKKLFHVNSEIHDFYTGQNSNHQPQDNLSFYQKGAYYSGIKVFNSLPFNIKKLPCDVKRFKLYLGKYLHLKSFYTLEEYFKVLDLKLQFCIVMEMTSIKSLILITCNSC